MKSSAATGLFFLFWITLMDFVDCKKENKKNTPDPRKNTTEMEKEMDKDKETEKEKRKE